MELTFSEDKLAGLSARDVMNLSRMIISDNRINKKHKVHVGSFTATQDPANKLMMSVTVKFQAWEKDEIGEGEIWYWSAYRAHSFACSNTGINKYPPMPFDGTPIPLTNTNTYEKALS